MLKIKHDCATGPADFSCVDELMTELIRLTIDRSIATVTLNRPEVDNAVDLETARAVLDAAIRCDQDRTIRCVVLTGSGRLFCAGGDIALMQRGGDAVGAAISELAGTLHMAVTRLARMAKPLICAINSPAAGAGVGLAVLGQSTPHAARLLGQPRRAAECPQPGRSR